MGCAAAKSYVPPIVVLGRTDTSPPVGQHQLRTSLEFFWYALTFVDNVLFLVLIDTIISTVQ